MNQTDAQVEFGALLRRLRGERKQPEFGRDLGYDSRTSYGMVETGQRRPSPTAVDRLLDLFPDHTAEIEARVAAIDAEREASSGRRSGMTLLQLQIMRMTRVGRFGEATASLDRALAEPQEPSLRVWLLDQRADRAAADEDEREFQFRRDAIATAHDAGLHKEEIELCLDLARRLTVKFDYAEAHRVLDEALKEHQSSGHLWRRKGMVHWYAHDYPDAIACLQTARANGVPDNRLVHTRGQVLAEWGSFDRAIVELTTAIETATSPANAAYARSTRAFALFNMGDEERAMQEFDIAEAVTPHNAWLHYFRALCWISIGDDIRAIDGLKDALSCTVPRLNLPKRDNALRILREYGVEYRTSEGE